MNLRRAKIKVKKSCRQVPLYVTLFFQMMKLRHLILVFALLSWMNICSGEETAGQHFLNERTHSDSVVKQYNDAPTPSGTIPETVVETGVIVISVLFGVCCCTCFCWYRWNRKRRYAMWADEDVDEYVQL